MDKVKKITHDQLIEIGRKYLALKYPIVTTECVVGNGEQADIMCFDYHGNTILIEVKVSRVDFLKDCKKPFRKEPERGMGNKRYYLAPKELINKKEVPDLWGLMEYNLGTEDIRIIKGCSHQKSNRDKELMLLVSVLRRIGVYECSAGACNIKVYYEDRATKASVTFEDIDDKERRRYNKMIEEIRKAKKL